MKPRSYALIAALFFVAQAAYVALYSLLGFEYAGFTHAHNVVVNALMTALWLTAAVSMFARRSPLGFAFIAFGLKVSVVNGFLYAVAGGGPLGLLFLGAAAITAFCVKRSLPPLTEHVSARGHAFVG